MPIALLVFLFTLNTASIAAPTKIFEVSFEDVPSGGLICNVSFFGKPPPPATVDKIVRSALESAVLVDSSRDILAVAFLGDEAMNANQYSGAIIYKVADSRIMTMDEYSGVKSTTKDVGSYFVQTKEDKTFEGIKPERHWLTMTLVFPKVPPIKNAYGAAIAEAEKAAARGMDVNVYVSTGDKAMPTSWNQIRDPDGGYVFVEYKVSRKTIERKDKVLKTVP